MSKLWRILTAGLVLAGLLALTPGNTTAAAGVVGDGTPGSCSEAALDTALTGGGLVTFNCHPSDLPIVVTNEKSITVNTQIDGGGLITLDGQDSTRIFYVTNGASLDVSNLTLTGGSGAGTGPSFGGAIYIDGGAATITSSILTGNSATIDGGAIYVTSNSEVTITASTLSGNVADRGGALFLWGDTATLINSAFNDNIATSSPAQGGGIYNRATVIISGSTISGNQSGDGGGIYSQGELTITDSTINGNQADANGGGIDSNAPLTLINSTVSGNQAGTGFLRNGGGIWSNSPLIITASTISGNSTSEQGGGIFIDFTSTATITASTISGNQSGDHGGGILTTNGSTTALINSTLSGNQSGDSGGGLYTDGMLTITNSTLSGNGAVTNGGGFRENAGVLTLQNTLVANSTAGGNCFTVGAPYISLGGNLSDDASCTFFTEPSDLNDTQDQLGPLADNGGPTQTHLPQFGSPAIDNAVSAGCPDTDQRGIDRPQGDGCDIGSVEVIQGATYPLCVAYSTGKVTSPLYGQDCAAGTIEITPFDKSFCIDTRTGQLLYFFRGFCNPPRFEHTMPDDGELLTCVHSFTQANRWVFDHSQCGRYERPNTIPAAP